MPTRSIQLAEGHRWFNENVHSLNYKTNSPANDDNNVVQSSSYLRWTQLALWLLKGKKRACLEHEGHANDEFFMTIKLSRLCQVQAGCNDVLKSFPKNRASSE